MTDGKLLILEPIQDKHLEEIKRTVNNNFIIKQLSVACSREELKEDLKDAEIVIGQPPLDLLQNPQTSCPKLKLIQMTWAGTDIYTRSVLEFPKDRITLANASGAFGMVMSQFALGMILSVMFNFKDYHIQQQDGIWEKKGPVKSLDKAKVLIFGAGDIGSAIAKRLKGFDAYCIGVCRNTEKPRAYFNELCSLPDAHKFLPDADVVIGCIPNTSETEKFMNFEKLKSMKEDAIIVNVGRGNFIDCIALDELLKEGHLFGAALDVTDPEPLPEDHPLWSNPKCMITPHTSGTTFGHLNATEDLLCRIICENLSRYCNGEEIINQVY